MPEMYTLYWIFILQGVFSGMEGANAVNNTQPEEPPLLLTAEVPHRQSRIDSMPEYTEDGNCAWPPRCKHRNLLLITFLVAVSVLTLAWMKFK